MCVSLGQTLGASAGEREHVDQPARAAGNVPSEEEGVDLAVADRASVGEVVLANLEQ